MPNKDGLQVIRELKEFYKVQAAELSEIRVEEPRYVLLTAFKTTKMKQDAIKLGVGDIYEKPIQLEDLANLIFWSTAAQKSVRKKVERMWTDCEKRPVLPCL